MAESLCCSPGINTAPLTGYISQYKIKSLKFGGVVKKKTNTIWFYLDEISQEVKIIETESRMGLGLEEGEQQELFLMGIEFQMCNMKKLWRSILQSCKYT